MGIKLEEHKVYVDSVKMDMVPFSIAVKAVKEALDPTTESYLEELDAAMNELRNTISTLAADD